MSRTLRTMTVALAGVMLLGGVGVASGQEGEAPAPTELRPPQPKEPPTGPTVMTYAACVLLGGGLIFASVFPSKRGHQD